MLVPVNQPEQKQVNSTEEDFLAELENKIKENKAEVHEIDTSVVPTLEKMSEHSFNAICNPSVYAFREGLVELERLQNSGESVEQQLAVVDQIHMVLLMGNEQLNLKIIEMVPELCEFLKNSALYDRICTVLSDISHMNQNVIASLLSFKIFEKLDLSRKSSFSLVFSICDQNKSAWDAFVPLLRPEFKANAYINMLCAQYE